jgi:hypothetical protein
VLGIVIGARLWLISVFGSPIPIHDQWDAEAAFLFKPWLEGHLGWAALFAAHNEHRILLSRLLALGLLRLNGQWDAQLEMTVNAAVCGMIAVAVVAGASRFFSEDGTSYRIAAVILWLALPYAQENTLWGFQSSFYLMLIFSLAAIWGLSFHRAFSVAWWFGATSAVLAIFSLASGFFAAIAVIALAALRAIKRRRWPLAESATPIFAAVVLAGGFFLRVDFPAHAALKAHSALIWASVFARSLAWPFCNSAAAALLLYSPLCALAVLYFQRRQMADPHNSGRQRKIELLLAVGIWVVLQAAAIAYSRGGDGTEAIASRYMDVLALGALVNGAAGFVLLGALGRRRNRVILFCVWIGVVAGGAGLTSYWQFSGQAGRQAWLRTAEENVRAYIATGDRRYLEIDSPPRIPYPDGTRLASLLDDKVIREILPAAVRQRLRIRVELNPEGAFIPAGYPPQITNPPYDRSWGSYSGEGVNARGTMETATFAPRLSFLRIEIAGFLREGMSLELQSATSKKRSRFIPTTRIDASWRAGCIPVPASNVKLIARDANRSDWFAFREPTELGRCSFYAERFVAKGRFLFVAGVSCLFLSFIYRALIVDRLPAH